MAMMLPSWLRKALEFAGYEWPASNEDVLQRWSTEFSTLSSETTTAAGLVDGGIATITSHNSGPEVDAFASYITGAEANPQALAKFSTAANNFGTCCSVASGIVVTLKLAVIAQLGILAAAIITAAATLGLGSGIAFAAREVAKRLINAAINLAVSKVMGV